MSLSFIITVNQHLISFNEKGTLLSLIVVSSDPCLILRVRYGSQRPSSGESTHQSIPCRTCSLLNLPLSVDEAGMSWHS